MAQRDIRNLDGETAQVAVDGRCFVYFVNMRIPDNPANLTLRGGQGTSSISSGQNGPTRIISCYGWNPIINGGNNDVKYVWDASGSSASFSIHSVPATFTGGNTDGTEVQQLYSLMVVLNLLTSMGSSSSRVIQVH